MDKGAQSYRRFLDGDDDALGEIVDMYREGLILFIYKYVANLADAEDLAEDVFVELIVNPERYSFRSSLKTYIFTLGRNKAVDFVRKQSRIRPVREPEERLAELADLHTLESHIIRGEENRRLYEALDSIKEDYRTALHLVYLEELSYKEAARVMKKTPKQLENLVSRGKKAVRELMGEEGI